METLRKLHDLFAGNAEQRRIEHICIGLGYTAVALDDGSVGIAYTFLDEKRGCTLVDDQTDYENGPAPPVLAKLQVENLVERSVGLATVHALNHARAAHFDDDRGTLLDDLDVKEGDTVAMVGYFEPVARQIEERGAEVVAHDIGKGIGSSESFYAFLSSGDARALILTSTSVIGGTTESVLEHLPAGTPCALLGPTTPMVPEGLDHLPISVLGGTHPVETEAVVKAVRHGMGTKAIHRSSRKIYHRVGVDPVPTL